MKNATKKILLLSAVTFACSLSGCAKQSFPDVSVASTEMFMYSYDKPEAVAALGLTTVYVLAGSYQGLKAGQCVYLTTPRTFGTFSIAQVLLSNPSLRTPRTIAAAKLQQLDFHKRNSRLYDPKLAL